MPGKSARLFLAATLVLLLSACSGSGLSSQNEISSSKASAATDSPASEIIYPGLKFSLAPEEQRVLPYGCIEYFQQGTLCTLDVLNEYEGDSYIEPILEAFAYDEQGRKFKSQANPSVSHVWAGGSTYFNPGEKLMWGMEFAIGETTEKLVKIEIYADGSLVQSLPVNVTR
jgi:hypothetical protein